MRRPSAGQLAAGAAVVGLAFVWPLVSSWLVEALGVRALAIAILAVSAVSLVAVSRAVPTDLALGRADSLALLTLVGAAAVSGERVFLLLVPAWLQLAVARIFWRSVREGDSIFERVARTIQPYVPDFIRPYCRRATLIWACVFLANALVIATLAIAAPLAYWRTFTGWIGWAIMAVLAFVDFLVRKIYFRSYAENPIDRVFARLFPPDASEMGRRSNEYRRAKRISLGMEP